jgi:hypothetical protein
LTVYAAALQNPANNGKLEGLEETHQNASQAAAQACGADYAQTNISNGVVRLLGSPNVLLSCSVFIVALMLLDR